MNPSGENLALVGLVGFAVWQCRDAYTDMAPDLHELRNASDPAQILTLSQSLLDTDICVGGVALLAGIASSILTKSWIPIALLFGAFAICSGYHHMVLASPAV